MPLRQEDLQALQGLMAAQLSLVQCRWQSLQDSVGAQFQAVNQQVTTSTNEQQRLAHEQMKQTQEAETKLARILKDLRRTTRPGRMFAPTSGGVGSVGGGFPKHTARRLAS